VSALNVPALAQSGGENINEVIKLMNQNQLNDAAELRSVDQQQDCSALDRCLKQEMAKSAALTAADNRKILWLAMQTAPWLNCPLMSVQADILAELEGRMYPEYDGDSVKFTEWGWQTPEGEIRYLPNASAMPTASEGRPQT
jgi:hypothetical protein